MADSTVNLQITAEDLASAVILGIEKGFKSVATSIKSVNVASDKTRDSIKNTAEQGTSSMEGLSGVIRGIPFLFNQTLQMVQTLAQGLMSLAEPAMQLDRLNTQFKASSGSSALAAKDMQYVREEADRMGLVFIDTAHSFATFNASTRGTALEGEKTKEVFKGVTTAATALRLSTEETNGVLLAFSQMVGKGKVSAEELNQVGERLPGSLDLMAKSMGMTTAEFRKAAEEGRILATELLGKVGPALSSLYGDAAKEAANGSVAQLNRLKNAVFDLSATIGAGPLQVVGALASVLAFLGDSAKKGLAWLNDEKTGASSWAALAFAINTVAPAITAVAGGLTLLTVGHIAYTAATNLAASATGKFTIALLSNPLFLAGAAIIGVATVAIKLLGDTLNGTTEASVKAGKAIAETTEAQRKQAAEAKQLQDEYDKAFGVSLARQLEKREQQYQDDLKMLEKRLSNDLKKTGLTEAEKKKLIEKYVSDKLKLGELYYQATDKLRDDDRNKEQAVYDARVNDYIAFLKNMGRTEEADDQDFARKLQKQRKEVLDHFANREADAKANGQVLVGFEAEKQAALDNLQKQQFAEANRRGLDRVQKDQENAKKAADAQIAEIKRQAAEHIISEEQAADQVLQIEEGLLRKQLDLAKQRANTFNPGSTQYKKAIADIAAAEAGLTNNLAAQYKQREAAQKNSTANQLATAQNAYKEELLSLQQAETNGTISKEQANLERLKLERSYQEQLATIRATELAAIDPQTQVKEYQAALSAKLDADKAYSAAKKAVTDEELRQTTQATAAATKASLQSISQQSDAYKQYVQQIGDAMTGTLASAIGKVKDLSDQAYNSLMAMYESGDHYNQFNAQFRETSEGVEAVTAALEEARTEFGKLTQAVVGDVNAVAFTNWANSVQAEAEKIRIAFLEQKKSALEFSAALEEPEKASAGLLAQINQSMQGMNLLDKSTLDNLKGQIDRVKNAMLAFTEQIMSALKSLQDEWDNMSMSKVQLEEKRYREQVATWQEEYRKAQQQQNTEALDGLRKQMELMDKIHQAKLADLATDPANNVAPIRRAVGGWIPGVGDRDSVPALLTPGEFVIRKAAAGYWGDGMLAAINNPWGYFGQQLQAQLAGISASLPAPTPVPRLAFAVGGPVVDLPQQAAGQTVNITIHTTQPVDDTLIRRKIAPELKRLAALRA